MMKRAISMGALAAVAFGGGAAMAQTSPAAFANGPVYYGNLGYSQMDQSDGDLGAITGRIGARFNPNLGVEGEASVGVKDDDFTVLGVPGTVKHDYDVAAYVVGTLPINDRVELFARGGYGYTKVKAELGGVSRTGDGESWNYGVGANVYLDPQNGIRGDWTRRDFTDSDSGEIDVYSVSYVRRF